MSVRISDRYVELLERLRIDDWANDAACGGKWRVLEGDDIEAAKALCDACPVLDQCREWVLSVPAKEDIGGYKGGLTKNQRDKIRRERANANPEKRCPRCTETKPATAFHRNAKRGDGRASYCAPCAADMKAAARAYNEAAA